MALHKLVVDDFYEDTYSLLAIHSTIEDYRIAYLLNQSLNINLKRKQQDLDFEYIAASYSIFEWEDEKQQITWNLVANICKREEESLTSTGSLFKALNKIIRTHNLIPEYKKVDYFIKINSDGNFINEREIVHKIIKIPQIATAFSIDVKGLKSKENLIFN